jgi:MFS family permease
MAIKKSSAFAIAVLFAINILNFYDRNVAGALTEPIRREFHLNDTEVGLFGSAFIWIYALIGVPLGRIADIWSRKRLLAWGVVVWSALTASTFFVWSFTTLMIARLGVGVGEAACAPTGTSWLGDLVPPSKRARALGLFMLGVPIGGALSYFFSGPVAQAYGWRAAMVLAAAPALLLVPALLALREPERGAAETLRETAATGSMWAVLKIPTMLWIIASGALINFNMYAIGTFMPALLGRIHGLKVGPAGIATGVLYMVGGVAGGLFGGWVGDRVIRNRRHGRMLAGAVIMLAGAPFGYYGTLQPHGAVIAAVSLWAVLYGTLNTYYGLVYSSIQDIIAPAQRGAAMAIYFMAMYLCGASFGPLLTGFVSDSMARRAAVAAGSAVITDAARAIGLQQAMLLIPALNVLLAAVLYAGSRTIVKDITRREAAALPPRAVAVS